MANYCMHCGTVLHPDFGLCPHCNRDRLNQMIYTQRTQAGFGPPQAVFADGIPAVQPVTVRQQPKTVEKPTRKPLLKIIVASMLTVVLLCLCLTATGIFTVRQATTEEALTEMVANAELSDLLGLMGEQAETGFYTPIKEYVLKNTGIRLKNATVDSLLEASGLKYYLAEQTAVYAKDLYNGTNNFSLKQKDIYRLLRANRREMENEIKISLSDDVLGQLAEVLANQKLIEKIGTEVLKETAPQVYYGLHFGLSYSAIAVLLAVAAVIFFAMLHLDFSLGILGCGVALTITGGLLALPALLLKLTPTLLNTLVGNHFLQSAITVFLNTNLIFSLLVFTVGVTMLLVRASILLLCKLFC